MAAEAWPQAASRGVKPREREGFALFAAVIVIAVIAALATVVTVTLSGDNDQDRIEGAADVLHRLASAIDTTTKSFYGPPMAKWPGTLSQLTHKISTADKYCAATFTFYASNMLSNWQGPYHLTPISTAGHPIAPGFFANNLLVRVSASDLAIQINGVSLQDAKALQLVVEKKSTGATGSYVTFALTDPTDVQYHVKSASNKC